MDDLDLVFKVIYVILIAMFNLALLKNQARFFNGIFTENVPETSLRPQKKNFGILKRPICMAAILLFFKLLSISQKISEIELRNCVGTLSMFTQ